MVMTEQLPQIADTEAVPAGYDGTYPEALATVDEFLASLGTSYVHENADSRVRSWQRYYTTMAVARVATGAFATDYKNPYFNVPTDGVPDVEAVVTAEAAAAQATPEPQFAAPLAWSEEPSGHRHKAGTLGYWREVGGMWTVLGVLSDGSYFKEKMRGRMPRVRRVADAIGGFVNRLAEIDE